MDCYYRLPLLLILSCTVLLVSLDAAEDKDVPCNHTPSMDRPDRVHIPVKEGYNSGGRSKRSTDDPFTSKFTVSVTYDSTVDSALQSSVSQQLKNTAIPQLTDFFESILMVRPIPGPLVFDRPCDGSFFVTEPRYCVSTCESPPMCGTATMPDAHLKACRQCNDNSVSSFADDCEVIGSDGSGVDATFSLYISAVNTVSCSGSTLAFAGACELEDEYDRPIAGYINYCPNAFDGTESDDYVLRVSKHELLHALGFSSGLYEYWRNETGGLRSPSGTTTNTVKTVTYSDWNTFNGDVSHTVSLLITPNIVEEGKRHFNCSTLEGVQLEDQGGSGTMGSHWEARITRGEIMNGVISTGAVFSRFTFALLQDSGWYKVNYSHAEQFIWARGSGCELSGGSCGGYIESQQAKSESISPFCTTAGAEGCNVERTAVSRCNLATFNSALPSQYQYFSSAAQGGSFQTADFCPYLSAFSNTRCADTANSESGLDNSKAQTFGPGARCVNHGTAWRASDGVSFIQQPLVTAGCYNYTCSNGQVTIHILDQSYVCTTAGQEISVSQTSDGITHTGSIICPSCLEICYDDFDNCQEAAQVYSEFLPAAPSVPIQVITTTSTSTSAMDNAMPQSSSSTTSQQHQQNTASTSAQQRGTTSPTRHNPTPTPNEDVDSSGSGDDTERPTVVTDDRDDGSDRGSGSCSTNVASFIIIVLALVIKITLF